MAAGVLVAAIAALLQLFLAATRANVDARDITYATVLAAQKMEELRAAAASDGGEAVEYLNARGDPLFTGPDGAAYERHWLVEPLLADPDNVVVMTVRVWPRGLAHRAVRLITLRARRAE